MDMTELEKFKHIFEGSNSAYGQTRKTDEFDERGKHKTRSFIIKQPPTSKMWEDHFNGVDPALGIIPINEQSKCKWACIDIDIYSLNHLELIKKIKDKKFPLIVCRSKSGGAHVFLFSDGFAPAALFRSKLKDIAAILGYANSEIFPKQNHVKVERGDTGSFLNLPYHNVKRPIRYAMKEDASAMTLAEFFAEYDKLKLTVEQLEKLEVKEDIEVEDDLLKGAPPCLKSLARLGIPNGQRNNGVYNFGVYLKKRYGDDNNTWKTKLHVYNDKYCNPLLDEKEVNGIIKSIEGKEYLYKCKDEPIASFCNSKKCMLQEFGVGDDFTPGLEIKEIKKYESDPPIFYVVIGEDSVEVEAADLHDATRFSLKCLEQINQAIPPISKAIWIRMLNKLLSKVIPIEAPESIKIDIQLKESLAEFINKAPGKTFEDVERSSAFTENGKSYFKIKSFWAYLIKSRSWPDKTWPQRRVTKKISDLFGTKEVVKKINNKSIRCMEMDTINLDKPILKKEKMKEPSFA
jgi:hypothetical protein